jgi:hypothetical protein
MGATVGRIREHIRINGRKCWTLFDSGAQNTYVVPEVAKLLVTKKLTKPFRTALGGGIKKATILALLDAQVEGRKVATHAMVVDDIGKDEEGKRIEVLFGALAMQQWGIRLIPKEERLDLTHYPKEFVEFSEACPDTLSQGPTDRSRPWRESLSTAFACHNGVPSPPEPDW